MNLNILHFDTLDSTNAYLKRKQGSLEDFSFVVASYQTAGKGREKRKWMANHGENLLFSILIKDPALLTKGPRLSSIAAAGVASFLEKEVGLKGIAYKWPNDVYVSGKKICGILLEGSLPTYLAIGVGVNVNQTVFEGDYRVPPTSVALEKEKTIDLQEFADTLFPYLASYLKETSEEEVLRYLQAKDFLFGKEVKLPIAIGIAAGIGEDFSLLVEDEGDGVCRVLVGEASLVH